MLLILIIYLWMAFVMGVVLIIDFKWTPGRPDSFWRGVRTVPSVVAWGLIWPITLWKIWHGWRLREKDLW